MAGFDTTLRRLIESNCYLGTLARTGFLDFPFIPSDLPRGGVAQVPRGTVSSSSFLARQDRLDSLLVNVESIGSVLSKPTKRRLRSKTFQFRMDVWVLSTSRRGRNYDVKHIVSPPA